MTDSSGTGRPEWLGTDLEDLDGVTPEVVGKVPDADLYLLAPTDVDLEDPPDRPIPVRMLTPTAADSTTPSNTGTSWLGIHILSRYRRTSAPNTRTSPPAFATTDNATTAARRWCLIVHRSLDLMCVGGFRGHRSSLIVEFLVRGGSAAADAGAGILSRSRDCLTATNRAASAAPTRSATSPRSRSTRRRPPQPIV